MFNFNSTVNPAAAAAAAAIPSTVAVQAKAVFPDLGEGNDNLVIQVPAYREPAAMMAAAQRIPAPKPCYAFQQDLLEGILDFLSAPAGDALYIYGPSGSGKTSCVCQAAALLGWPLVEMTLNSRFELSDLIGHNTIVQGEVKFIYGPLVEAMREGYILLLNEVDLSDPGELAGLNDVLEGRPLSVIQNGGEVIKPNPNFRLICTANTAGSGSSTGNFAGTGILNSAFLDRFRFIEAGYMPAEKEEALLKELYPALEDDTAKCMVRVANEIRRSHLSQGESSVFMTVPLTTRGLVKWASMVAVSGRDAEKALDIAFGNRLSGDEKVYLHRLFKDIFGDSAKKNAEAADATA